MVRSARIRQCSTLALATLLVHCLRHHNSSPFGCSSAALTLEAAQTVSSSWNNLSSLLSGSRHAIQQVRLSHGLRLLQAASAESAQRSAWPIFTYSSHSAIQHCTMAGRVETANAASPSDEFARLHVFLRMRRLPAGACGSPDFARHSIDRSRRDVFAVHGFAFLEHLHLFPARVPNVWQMGQMRGVKKWRPQLYLRAAGAPGQPTFPLRFRFIDGHIPSAIDAEFVLPSSHANASASAADGGGAGRDDGDVSGAEFELRVEGWDWFCSFVPPPSDLRPVPPAVLPAPGKPCTADSLCPCSATPPTLQPLTKRRRQLQQSRQTLGESRQSGTHSTQTLRRSGGAPGRAQEAGASTRVEARHPQRSDVGRETLNDGSLQQGSAGAGNHVEARQQVLIDEQVLSTQVEIPVSPEGVDGAHHRERQPPVSRETRRSHAALHLPQPLVTRRRLWLQQQQRMADGGATARRRLRQSWHRTDEQAETVIVMSPSAGKSAEPFITLLLHHMRYHFHMGVSWYLVYLTERVVQFASDHRLLPYIADGRLRLVLWDSWPRHESAQYQTNLLDVYACQALIYNHAMLSLWGTPGTLALPIDVDEYVLAPSRNGAPTSLAQIYNECGRQSALLTLDRFRAKCKACNGSELPLWLPPHLLLLDAEAPSAVAAGQQGTGHSQEQHHDDGGGAGQAAVGAGQAGGARHLADEGGAAGARGRHPLLQYMVTNGKERMGKTIVDPTSLRVFKVHDGVPASGQRASKAHPICARLVHLATLFRQRRSAPRGDAQVDQEVMQGQRWWWAAVAAGAGDDATVA